MDAQAERKKLVQKQQNEIKAMEKDVKKKKGFLKEEAQKKMEETQARFEKELSEFDEKNGTSEASKDKEKEKEKAPLKIFENEDFATMGRSELDEECVLRGISKKNMLAAKQQKEAQEKEAKKPTPKAAAAKPAPTPAAPKPTVVSAKPAPKKKKEESESESEEESDSDSGEEMTEEEKAKAEKFAKIEQVVQKSIIKLLQKFPQGVHTEEVPDKLAQIGVKNFRPDVVGYKTLHEFFDNQPEMVCRYEASEQVIYPGGRKK